MTKLKIATRPRYTAEFNRCVGDNINRVMHQLARAGYVVERVPQLTTLSIRRPKGAPFRQFAQDLRDLLQPHRGSLTLHSTTGRTWSCTMRGNRPGEFVRI